MDVYKVFNRKGKFIKNVHIGPSRKIKTLPELETYLRENQLFAQASASFEHRADGWDKLSFIDKLKNLGWQFGSNGELKGTDW